MTTTYDYDATIGRGDVYDLYPDLHVAAMFDCILADARARWPERELYSISTDWTYCDDIQVMKLRGVRGDVLVHVVPDVPAQG